MEISIRNSLKRIFLFTPKEVKRFYAQNSYFKKAIDNLSVLYIDNHIVINSSENLTFYDGKIHLSQSALENIRNSCISKKHLAPHVRYAHYRNAHYSGSAYRKSRYSNPIIVKSLDSLSIEELVSLGCNGEELPMTFGRMLSVHMRNNKLSNDDLADLVGISSKTVGRLRRDESRPKIETAVAICLAMKLYPWDSKYLIELAGYNLEAFVIYNRLITLYYNEGLPACNSFLKRNGKPPLTNKF